MITRKIVLRVCRLLEKPNMNRRKIARRVGVDRSTVDRIACGRHRHLIALPDADNEPVERPDEPPRRCPDCGGLVTMPCRLCGLRESMAEKAWVAPSRKMRPRCDTTSLKLLPRHALRYQQVRLWRKLGVQLVRLPDRK
jgi:hypothetical protein